MSPFAGLGPESTIAMRGRLATAGGGAGRTSARSRAVFGLVVWVFHRVPRTIASRVLPVRVGGVMTWIYAMSTSKCALTQSVRPRAHLSDSDISSAGSSAMLGARNIY